MMRPPSPAFVVATTPLTEHDATIADFGGAIRISGPVTPLEGSAPELATVVEFPDAVSAAAWCDAAGLGDPHSQLDGSRHVWMIEGPPQPA